MPPPPPPKPARDLESIIGGNWLSKLGVLMLLIGITLLGAGIGLQQRQLRLSGLLLFAVCLAKLFFYDLSQLDTLSRILSFIVLGILLITVSGAYSRFRDQIKRYL
ncbi:MAG: DUF2339 domain-containing protein [Bryobacterales bacterium]|nr:DUF2339 domain-containing protein [Bryobacterales bacterium]